MANYVVQVEQALWDWLREVDRDRADGARDGIPGLKEVFKYACSNYRARRPSFLGAKTAPDGRLITRFPRNVLPGRPTLLLVFEIAGDAMRISGIAPDGYQAFILRRDHAINWIEPYP
jgi:hypothetical protein